MIDQVFDNFRKASETTMQMQQEMFKKWMGQWPAMPTPQAPGAGAWAEQAQAFQKKWIETVSELLNKHRESLDSQYKAGIRTIEDAFKVGEAKTPEDYRRIAEDLWRKNFESLKSSAESQVRDFQAAVEKWFDLAAKAKV
jgi:hypothetical protein